ncbi:MAG TPA: DUF5677 domain-containing protein [Galbitalea sp.]|nr:DUF5677 domain-containing protein [Galbitalea sp.]
MTESILDASEVDLQLADNRERMTRLQRSIRASIATSRSRATWDPDDLVGHAATFGDTLEWRHEDLLWEIGEDRLSVETELQRDLEFNLGGYSSYFATYLTVAEHLNTCSGTIWRTRSRARTKLNVLCELHAQALTVAREISLLASHGMPTGAIARWRTLYELSVISAFIAVSPAQVAERYEGSHVVDYANRLRRDDVDRIAAGRRARRRTSEDKEVENEFDRLLAKFGPEYGRSYGWAAERLGMKQVTFAKIEARVSRGRGRGPQNYRQASHHVHADRVSSMATLTRDPQADAHFRQGGLAIKDVLVHMIVELQEMTWTLGAVVSRTQKTTEALYWAYVCYMVHLDVMTEANWHPVVVYPDYVRQKQSIVT